MTIERAVYWLGIGLTNFTGSSLAQLLLMRRKLENWYCWLLVNSLAVPLFASRELYLTAFIYGLFWCNAWYGLYRWQRELSALDSSTATAGQRA